MTKLDNMAQLRHLVNAAHNYAATEYDCTITILQEYKEENYVTVGFYADGNSPEDSDPEKTAELGVTNFDVPYNCKFVFRDYSIKDKLDTCLISNHIHLFRLLFA